MIRSTASSQKIRCSPSVGRNTTPAPHRPAAGNVIPASRSATFTRNSCGNAVRIPAPSPVFSSHPHAPRCSMCCSIVNAFVTISCDFRPLMCATNPTPQESCSNCESYNPVWRGARKDSLLPTCHGPPRQGVWHRLWSLPTAEYRDFLAICVNYCSAAPGPGQERPPPPGVLQ